MKAALDTTNRSQLLKRAAWNRDLAKRAAEFATWLSWDADRARLRGHAERLDEEAAALEKQAAALGPDVSSAPGFDPRPDTAAVTYCCDPHVEHRAMVRLNQLSSRRLLKGTREEAIEDPLPA
jgi:hypothetical protein